MVKIDKSKVIVPTNDYVFKRIFGRVGNEIITKGFLNSILNEEIQSVDFEGNTILEKDFSQYILTDVCEIHILELPKLEKIVRNNKLTPKEQLLANWVKFLLNPNKLEVVDMENNQSLKKAKEEFDEIQKDEYEQRMAESRLIHLMDIKSVEETGYDKGFEQGEKEKAEKIARKMLSKGKTIREIMELTELKKEEIEKLKEKMKNA